VALFSQTMQEVPDGVVFATDPNLQNAQNARNIAPRPNSIELDSKGYPELPCGNGVGANHSRGEFRCVKILLSFNFLFIWKLVRKL